jgi:hypothetical protein
MSSSKQIWIGHGHNGERATLEIGETGTKILILGSQAGDLAAIAALSAKEAGWSPTILDLDGSCAKSLSGYLDTYDYHSFLYDSFRLEEPEAWHSQLAAAAYTVALDLSTEEEAIINSAMQVVASDGSMLSPVSLHDVMSKVEGFRGFYVEKLNGRIGALRLFDAVDDQGFDRLMRGNVTVDFHRAPYPQAAELAAALFLAKILAIVHAEGRADGFFIITEAHRIFRALPRPAHSNRLLVHLLEWSATIAMSSRQYPSLSPILLQSSPVRVYSSDAWHSQPRQVRRILSGNFMLQDRRSEGCQSFVPRRIMTKTAGYAPARAGKYPTPELAQLILEEIARFPLCTPQSIAQYIAPEFLSSDVISSLASLEKEGSIILEPKESGSGPKVFAYTLSEKGRKLLEELGN